MTGPNRIAWWGGIVAAAVAWGFTGIDLSAHHGVLDRIDVLLIFIGGVFIAIPRIDRLSASVPIFGRTGVSVSINDLERAVRAADAASSLATQAGDTAQEASKLFESWLRELETLFTTLEATAPDRATYARAIFRFINTRLEDISEWVGDADEEVRAALWWWSDPDGGASIVAAPRISDRETLEHIFAPGEGILGRVLIDGEPANVADAPADVNFERIAQTAPRYHGLLCLPIVVRGRVAGVLTVDRVKAEAFGEDSVRFARQVAELVKLASLHAAVPSDVFSLPFPEDSGTSVRPILDFP